MNREERAKAKTLRNAEHEKNKSSNESRTIDEKRDEKTLKGHLKQEGLPQHMSGMENSQS